MTKKALILLLVVVIPVFMLIAPAHAGSWQLTVQTDKPYYYYGDKVNVNGTLTYNDYLDPNIGISIVVKLSGASYYLKTTTTDGNGKFSDSFTLAGPNALVGTYVVNVTAQSADTIVTNQTTFSLIPAFVAPEVPVGTITAFGSMAAALLACSAMPRLKRKKHHTDP